MAQHTIQADSSTVRGRRATRSLRQLLEANGLGDAADGRVPNADWAGSTLGLLERGTERFVLKRISPRDWAVRATRDVALREGFVANNSLRLVEPLVAPYLGAASDGSDIVILMPDLSDELIAWERSRHPPLVGPATLDSIIDAIAWLHAMRWADYRPTSLGLGLAVVSASASASSCCPARRPRAIARRACRRRTASWPAGTRSTAWRRGSAAS